MRALQDQIGILGYHKKRWILAAEMGICDIILLLLSSGILGYYFDKVGYQAYEMGILAYGDI